MNKRRIIFKQYRPHFKSVAITENNINMNVEQLEPHSTLLKEIRIALSQ